MAQEVQKLEDDISAALNDQTTLQKNQVCNHALAICALARAAVSPLRLDQCEEEYGERDQGYSRERERDFPSGK
jgi:hypothetical protein